MEKPFDASCSLSPKVLAVEKPFDGETLLQRQVPASPMNLNHDSCFYPPCYSRGFLQQHYCTNIERQSQAHVDVANNMRSDLSFLSGSSPVWEYASRILNQKRAMPPLLLDPNSMFLGGALESIAVFAIHMKIQLDGMIQAACSRKRSCHYLCIYPNVSIIFSMLDLS